MSVKVNCIIVEPQDLLTLHLIGHHGLGQD